MWSSSGCFCFGGALLHWELLFQVIGFGGLDTHITSFFFYVLRIHVLYGKVMGHGNYTNDARIGRDG